MSNPKVKISTSKGDITIELFEKEAPVTVKNFLKYVDDKFYDGTIFHRVIDNFMIQGGGMDSKMNQKAANEPIINEADKSSGNKRGTIAMARTQVVDSATCQFFINVADNDFLDFQGRNPRQFGYCVFGKVIEGMETVDAIKSVKTGSCGYYEDVPEEPVVILSAVRV